MTAVTGFRVLFINKRTNKQTDATDNGARKQSETSTNRTCTEPTGRQGNATQKQTNYTVSQKTAHFLFLQ